MLIRLKNKDTLKIDEFSFKCCIGKKGLKAKKVEGDLKTPKGKFEIGDLYYRDDRLKIPFTKSFPFELKFPSRTAPLVHILVPFP